MSDTYLEESPEEAQSSLKTLQSYCDKLIHTQKSIEEVTKGLETLKRLEKELSSVLIPQFLEANGLQEIRLSSGEKISVKEDVYSSIPKEDIVKRKAALEYIKTLPGGEEIIKKDIIISSDIDLVKAVLDEQGLIYSDNEDIHPQTLKAFFRDILGIGKNKHAILDKESIPECIKIYTEKKTIITK